MIIAVAMLNGNWKKKMVNQTLNAGTALLGFALLTIPAQAAAVEILKTDRTTITLYGQVNKG